MGNKVFLLLAIAFIIAFFVGLVFLSQFPLVLGHDGAYYLSRLQQFKQGKMTDSIASTPPVFFAITAFFSVFFEKNFSINLVAAIFSALLGISVFLLARLLLKDNWVALACALFVLFSRQEIILLTELKKNLAGLFFILLFFYFFFLASKERKYLVAAIAVLFFGFFTHKSVPGMVATVLLAFIPLQLAFGRKVTVETKNFVLLVLLGVIALLVLFLFSEATTAGIAAEAQGWLNETRDSSAAVNLSGYGLSFLAAAAGLLYCFLRAKKEHLFFASWFLVGLWTSFPFVSGSASWRFALMLVLPVAFLAGILLQEIKQRFGTKHFFAVFVLLLLFSVIFYLNEIRNTRAVFTPADYDSLQALSAMLEQQKPCVVFASGTTFYWAEYLINNCDVKAVQFQQIFSETKRLGGAGINAFVLADSNPEKREIKMFDSNNFLEFGRSGTRILFRPIGGSLATETGAGQQGYNFAKLSSPFALLFFPTELPMLFNAPFAFLLRIFAGIPLTFAVFGFVLFLVHKKFFNPKQAKN